jgi:hypothetical protein
MKINMTFEIDDEDRMALAMRNGTKGRADRETIETEIKSLVDTAFEDYRFDYTVSKELEA